MAFKFFTRKQTTEKKTKVSNINSPEIGSGLVRVAHKIRSANSESQVIKIGTRYFRVRELG